MITPVQCRMARAAIGWGVRDLAAKAGVSVSTVVRFENEQAEPIRVTVEAIQRVLEAEGVEFTASGGVQPREQQAEAPSS
jgi:transcriptional regulator with XRE-family HTH domain